VTALLAAAPPSPTLLGRMEALNIRTVHVYGLTETYGPHTVSTWQDDWEHLPTEQRARLLARQGQGYTTADLVRVVDADMRDVPRDAVTMGEVVMRGNNVMAGYFADEKATETAFHGGWFHSGDLAVWHPDNAVELRDRGKTSSSPAARTSPPSRSSRRSALTRRCSRRPWSRSRTITGENGRRHS
jgi:fatty-acyl-CoA synthase